MKNNRCHLFLIVLILSPVTLFTNPTRISAKPSNRFPIFPPSVRPRLSGEQELEDALQIDFRELQMEILENFENIENLENIENIENLKDIENTENPVNIEEEVNLGIKGSSDSADCKIDSVTTTRLLSSGTLRSKAKDRQLESKDSQNESQQDSDIWCELNRQCGMISVFGLGRIFVCENGLQCVSATSAEEQCDTVRTCACIFRPGIGKIQVCRSQLACG